MKKYIQLPLLACLLAACSSNGTEPFVEPPINPEPEAPLTGFDYNAPIVPATGLGGVDVSRAGGVINPSATSNLAISMFRIDQDETTKDYPADYTDATNVTGPLNATLSGNTTPGTATATVAFATTEYYLADFRQTKVVGVYPQVAASAFTAATGQVAYTIDGVTDIMATGLAAGGKQVSGSPAVVQPALTFNHTLSQIKVLAYAADAPSRDVWGGVTGVTITNEPTTCTLTLPALSGTGNTTAAYGSETDGSFVVSTLDGTTTGTVAKADIPLVGDKDGSDNQTYATVGYSLIAPAASNRALTLSVVTEDGNATITVPGRIYEAGKAYQVILKLTAVTIVPTVAIAAWTEDDTPSEVEL